MAVFKGCYKYINQELYMQYGMVFVDTRLEEFLERIKADDEVVHELFTKKHPYKWIAVVFFQVLQSLHIAIRYFLRSDPVHQNLPLHLFP